MKIITFLIFGLITFLGKSQNISQLYEKVSDAVVLIKASETHLIGQDVLNHFAQAERFGCGFIVSDIGEIMTAAHIVQTADNIRVKFSDGQELPAKVLYSYPTADVALIKITSFREKGLKIVKLSDSDKVKIGDQIFIIGSPFGLGRSLSVGYVSGKHSRKNIENNFTTTDLIQTDAAINAGSSGAPMFNMKGEVIGIASFILSNSKGFQGLGFAATSNIAKSMLLEKKALWSGLDAFLMPNQLAQILNVPQKSGLLIQKVSWNSLGGYLGLCGGQSTMNINGEEIIVGGDIILSLEEIPLVNENNIHKAWLTIQKLKTGDSIKLTIFKKGKIIEIKKIIP